MRRNVTIITMALLVCAIAGAVVLAKNKVHTITFDQDTQVNGTVVKKGEYQARFNEETNELTILRDNRAIATTTVKEESLNQKAPGTSYDLKTTDNGAILTKITFGGDRYSLMISDTNAADGQ